MNTCANASRLISAICMALPLWLVGCDDPVSSVRGGMIKEYQRTTVGNAFDAYFDNPQWSSRTLPNKTTMVEFKGQTRRAIVVVRQFGEAALVIPQGCEFKAEFVVNLDDTFELTRFLAPIADRGNSGGMWKTAFALQGVKMHVDGVTPDVIRSDAPVVQEILDGIYAGAPD